MDVAFRPSATLPFHRTQDTLSCGGSVSGGTTHTRHRASGLCVRLDTSCVASVVLGSSRAARDGGVSGPSTLRDSGPGQAPRKLLCGLKGFRGVADTGAEPLGSFSRPSGVFRVRSGLVARCDRDTIGPGRKTTSTYQGTNVPKSLFRKDLGLKKNLRLGVCKVLWTLGACGASDLVYPWRYALWCKVPSATQYPSGIVSVRGSIWKLDQRSLGPQGTLSKGWTHFVTQSTRDSRSKV